MTRGGKVGNPRHPRGASDSSTISIVIDRRAAADDLRCSVGRQPSAVLLSHPRRARPVNFRSNICHRLRKLRKLVSAVSARPVAALRCRRSSHAPPIRCTPRGPARHIVEAGLPALPQRFCVERELGRRGRASCARGGGRCLVRLPKGHGPSVLPQPCATPRVASGIQGRDFK